MMVFMYLSKSPKNTFLIARLFDDFESKSGLKECDEEYFVIPHPSIPPPVLLANPV